MVAFTSALTGKHRWVLLYEGPRHDRWEVLASCDSTVLTHFSASQFVRTKVILFYKPSIGPTGIWVGCCQRCSGWPLLCPHPLFPLQWNSNLWVKSSYYFDCDFGKFMNYSPDLHDRPGHRGLLNEQPSWDGCLVSPWYTKGGTGHFSLGIFKLLSLTCYITIHTI